MVAARVRLILLVCCAVTAVAFVSYVAFDPAAPASKPKPSTPAITTMQGPVVVATALPGKKAHFPDIVKLPNKHLFAAYREGLDHIGQDGRILTVESRDNGKTWSQPRVIVDTPYDDRDPKLVSTRHGLLLSYFATDWSTAPASVIRGTYVVRSTNKGTSWSAPIPIRSKLTGASNQTDAGYRLGWNASHGALIELSNGDLLAPLYGTMPNDKWQRATVVRSSDGGQTWDSADEITLAASPGMHFQEPVFTHLGGNRLAALIRTAGAAFLVRSNDGGRSWSPPIATDMYAASHHLLRLKSGALLITYGDFSGRFGQHRVTVGRLVRHPDQSWDGWQDHKLHDSGVQDQTNPSSVEIKPRTFLTLSYDVNQGTIVGIITTRDYYDPPESQKTISATVL